MKHNAKHFSINFSFHSFFPNTVRSLCGNFSTCAETFSTSGKNILNLALYLRANSSGEKRNMSFGQKSKSADKTLNNADSDTGINALDK
jgi:hypothetical protein